MAVRVIQLARFEFVLVNRRGVAHPNHRREFVRLGNLLAGLEVAAAWLHAEQLPAAVRPDGLDRDRRRLGSRRRWREPQPKSRRHAALVDLERRLAIGAVETAQTRR